LIHLNGSSSRMFFCSYFQFIQLTELEKRKNISNFVDNFGQAVRIQLVDGLLADLLQDVRFLGVYKCVPNHFRGLIFLRNPYFKILDIHFCDNLINEAPYQMHFLRNCLNIKHYYKYQMINTYKHRTKRKFPPKYIIINSKLTSP
jgi:hypothetical protein